MDITLLDNDELNAHVRSVTIDGEPWFVAKDICDFLGTRTTNLSAIVNADDIRTYTIGTNAGPRNYAIISEPGMYKLVFRSRKPEAEAFTDWVSRVVLPTLRKTGTYKTPGAQNALPRVEDGRAAFISVNEMTEELVNRGFDMHYVCIIGQNLSRLSKELRNPAVRFGLVYKYH